MIPENERMSERRVVILGGYGTFGRHIAEDVCSLSDTNVVIAGPARCSTFLKLSQDERKLRLRFQEFPSKHYEGPGRQP